MEDQSGVEDVAAAWLCSLAPRTELVARMSLHLRFHGPNKDRSYFARISLLINELDLSAEDLNTVRADARRLAAILDEDSRAWTRMVEQTVGD
jgi:hypothetical protein